MREITRLSEFARSDDLKWQPRDHTPRLDWSTIDRFLRQRSPFLLERNQQGNLRVVGITVDGTTGFDLSGFAYLNLDGLVQALCILETMRDHGYFGRVVLPHESHLRTQLVDNGFTAVVRRIGRLQDEGFEAHEVVPDETFILGRPFVFRAESTGSLSDVQGRMDSFLRSERLLIRLGLEKRDSVGGENRWEWAPAIAQAMHELLKNVVQWSGVGRAFIAMEHIPNTILRIIIADVGNGIGQDNPSLASSPWPHLDPLQWALLYRYVHDEKHGLFTVANTIARWGGELRLRSGNRSAVFKAKRGFQTSGQLVETLRRLVVEDAPFLPGVQIRVDFTLPASSERGHRI